MARQIISQQKNQNKHWNGPPDIPAEPFMYKKGEQRKQATCIYAHAKPGDMKGMPFLQDAPPFCNVPMDLPPRYSTCKCHANCFKFAPELNKPVGKSFNTSSCIAMWTKA